MSGARPRVAIAHDYLTQRGGAERVVLAMARAFPRPGSTPRCTTRGHLPTSRTHRTSREPDRGCAATSPGLRLAWSLESTPSVLSSAAGARSGTGGPRVLLLARALALPDRTYLGGPRAIDEGASLLCCAPRCALGCRAPVATTVTSRSRGGRDGSPHVRHRRRDRARAAQHERRRRAVDRARARGLGGIRGLPLVVSRLLPYKNVDVVVDAVRGTDHRLVVVGAGPGRDALLASLPANVRLLSG